MWVPNTSTMTQDWENYDLVEVSETAGVGQTKLTVKNPNTLLALLQILLMWVDCE